MSSAADWKAKGNAAFTSKQFDEAIRCFTEAIKISPLDHVLYSNRSGAYASKGMYKEALDDAKKCISIKPDWPKGYSRKGLAEYQLNDIKSAMATYMKGLEYDPSNVSLKDSLSQLQKEDPDFMLKERVKLTTASLLRTKQFKKYCEEDSTYQERLSVILEEIMKDPKNLQIAMSLCPDKRIKEALTILLGLPEEEIDHEAEAEKAKAAARMKAAEEEKLKRQKAEAERLRRPEEIEAENCKNKGNELYKSRQFEEALKAYDEAISLDPNNLIYYTNKAAVYLEMKEYEACLAECQKALDKRYEVKAYYETVAKIYNRMAICYKRKGDLENCIKCYEKSLMENNDRHTRSALVDVKLLKEKKDKEDYINPKLAEEHRLKGNEYFKSNDFPNAKQEYDEAIRRDPSDARLYANRAASLMKLLDLPGALKDAEKSLELDPSVAKVWARKGSILTLMKEYNKALTAFQKGLDIDANSIECQNGISMTMRKVQESNSSEKVDEEQIKRAMADPEIQAIMSDPQFSIILRKIQQDPSTLMQHLKDPAIASGIQKLMAAGILKMG